MIVTFLFFAFVGYVGSVPQPISPHVTNDKSFIGEGTNDIAKALLQGFVGQEENMVYSPLGYSSVLAIFAEGAKGDSRQEIASALHFPQDVTAVRQAYKNILQRLHTKKEPNTPEFRNWFYIYKNYTIEEELRQILREYYLTEVKTVDRPDDYISKKEQHQQDLTASEDNESEKEEVEVMIAMQRSLDDGKDHFSGMTDSSLKIKGKGSQSQMIIFNGLYFRGDWKEPFVKNPAHDSTPFYKSENEKISVATIRCQGEFEVGEIEDLDARVIEFPYKGERYSLLIVVPKARGDLPRLISDLSLYPIQDIFKQTQKKLVDVCLPSFEMDCISKPISSFTKLGLSKVTSIFDPEKADLSSISKEPGLYVEELVQMVTFKVDADYSSTSFLSASAASQRSSYEPFQINQPFLFFLKDKIDDIIVINGKLVDPTPSPDFFST